MSIYLQAGFLLCKRLHLLTFLYGPFNLSLTRRTLFLPTHTNDFMNKILVLALGFFLSLQATAQELDTTIMVRPVNLPTPTKTITAGDHFMFQLAHNIWQGAPDSISNRMNSLNRSANVYLMLNKPFKTNEKLAIGIGLGITTSNIYFKKTLVQIEGNTSTLSFINADSLNHFKKYKVSTAYLEVPLELRFSSNPYSPNKSIKAAIGLKGGILLSAKTKGTTLQDRNDNVLNDYKQKIISKSYFNSNHLAATARIGYGLVSLFGTYSLTGIFKDAVTADMKLVQVGLTISGL